MTLMEKNVLAISRDEFDSIAIFDRAFRRIWQLEDAFTVFGISFLEIEKSLLYFTIERNYDRSVHASNFVEFDIIRQELNLKLISLLASARAYEEYSSSIFSELNKTHGLNIEYKSYFSKEFDSKFEYRLMHRLRNHALHENLPLNIISLGGTNVYQKDSGAHTPSKLRYTIDPKIPTQDIVNSKKISKKLRDEVAALGVSHLDLKFLCRQYVSSVSNIHHALREQIVDLRAQCRAKTQWALEALGAKKGKPPESAIAKNHIDNSKEIFLLLERHSTLDAMSLRWRGLKHVQRTYVSSEVISTRDTYPQSHPEILIEE